MTATELADAIHDLICEHIGDQDTEASLDMAWNALTIELDRVDDALMEIEENSDED
jgi:hypothetical protein